MAARAALAATLLDGVPAFRAAAKSSRARPMAKAASCRLTAPIGAREDAPAGRRSTRYRSTASRVGTPCSHARNAASAAASGQPVSASSRPVSLPPRPIVSGCAHRVPLIAGRALGHQVLCRRPEDGLRTRDIEQAHGRESQEDHRASSVSRAGRSWQNFLGLWHFGQPSEKLICSHSHFKPMETSS
jgi:hypothetical protein